MFTVLVNLLDERLNASNVDNIKKAVQEALIEHDRVDLTKRQAHNGDYTGSYASAVKSRSSKICVSRGPTLKVPKFISFFVMLNEKHAAEFVFSRDTKRIVLSVLKPV